VLKTADSNDDAKPWVKMAGNLSHLHEETLKIDNLIEDEFERIEQEEWE
jgi:hypothetical protein